MWRDVTDLNDVSEKRFNCPKKRLRAPSLAGSLMRGFGRATVRDYNERK